eukprot:scaffold171256_cov18-Tisochrysis_lutea.AAC.1
MLVSVKNGAVLNSLGLSCWARFARLDHTRQNLCQMVMDEHQPLLPCKAARAWAVPNCKRVKLFASNPIEHAITLKIYGTDAYAKFEEHSSAKSLPHQNTLPWLTVSAAPHTSTTVTMSYLISSLSVLSEFTYFTVILHIVALTLSYLPYFIFSPLTV